MIWLFPEKTRWYESAILFGFVAFVWYSAIRAILAAIDVVAKVVLWAGGEV